MNFTRRIDQVFNRVMTSCRSASLQQNLRLHGKVGSRLLFLRDFFWPLRDRINFVLLANSPPRLRGRSISKKARSMNLSPAVDTRIFLTCFDRVFAVAPEDSGTVSGPTHVYLQVRTRVDNLLDFKSQPLRDRIAGISRPDSTTSQKPLAPLIQSA